MSTMSRMTSRPNLETLEARLTPSAPVSENGNLYIESTESADVVSVYNVTIHVTNVRFVDGAWIGSAFRGTQVDRGTATCGLLGRPTEKWAVRGKLIARGAAHERLERDPRFEPGERRPQAEVNPTTECDVCVARPRHVQQCRVTEAGWIAVRCM